MEINSAKRIYFIGIGGIGMSALARYFNYQGKTVSGYDRTQTPLTDELQAEGINIHFEDNITLLDKNADIVIYTPAIPAGHKELNFYRDNDYALYKRSRILGMLSENKFSIAIAGSHGKTTVSSMIAWILKDSGYDCTAFLGGISVNFNSNFVAGDNDVVVAEADEFDRSFLQLSPDTAVITATDSDHLEIYGSQKAIEETFTEFSNKIKSGGTLVARSNLPILANVREKIWRYALDDKSADLFAAQWKLTAAYSDVQLSNGMQYKLIYPGIHNIENSIAAASVALLLGIDVQKIEHALSSFKGVHRRFELVYQDNSVIYIDDYAHHPEEIRMFLQSVKKIYPGKKLTAIFQPHLFSRTNDLKDGFAESLDLADEIYLLPIYPARELPVEGVHAGLILERMQNKNAAVLSKEALLETIRKNDTELLCTIGAGDIDQLVKPIADILSKKGGNIL